MQLLSLNLFTLLLAVQIILIAGCTNVDRISSGERPHQVGPNPDNKPNPPNTTLAPQTKIVSDTRLLCASGEGSFSKESVDAFLASNDELTPFEFWQLPIPNKPPDLLPWFSSPVTAASHQQILSVLGESGKAGIFKLYSVQTNATTPPRHVALVSSEMVTIERKGSGQLVDVIPMTPATAIYSIFSQRQDIRFFSHPRESSFFLYADDKSDRFKLTHIDDNSVQYLELSPKEYFQPTLSADGKWAAFLRQSPLDKLDLVACQTKNFQCHTLFKGDRNSYTAQVLTATNAGLIWMNQTGKNITIFSARWEQLPVADIKGIHFFESDAPANMALYVKGQNLDLVFTQEIWKDQKLQQGIIRFFRINAESLAGEIINEYPYPEFLIGADITSPRGALREIIPAPWNDALFFSLGHESGALALDAGTKDWKKYRPHPYSKSNCRSFSAAPEMVQIEVQP